MVDLIVPVEHCKLGDHWGLTTWQVDGKGLTGKLVLVVLEGLSEMEECQAAAGMPPVVPSVQQQTSGDFFPEFLGIEAFVA